MMLRPRLIATTLLLLLAAGAARADDRARRVVYYTGSFNPVHEGHLNVARTARRALNADLVVLVPNPAGVTPKRLVSMKRRVKMLRKATKDEPGIEVADGRLRRRFKRKGHDGLHRELHRRFRKDQLYRVWGTDSFLGNLQNGVVQQHIAAGETPVVVKRPGYELPDELPAAVVVLDELPRDGPPISSTAIRQAIAAGQRPAGLNPSVQRYIAAHGLFR